MATSAGPRMPYLSLALFAQRALDALLKFIESGDDSVLEPALGDTIHALKERGPENGALGAFAQVRTLHEAWPGDEIEVMVSRLEDLHRGMPEGKHDRIDEATKAAEQFYRLSTRALRGFGRPSTALPPSVRALCRTR